MPTPPNYIVTVVGLTEQEMVEHFDALKHVRFQERTPGRWVCVECQEAWV